MTAFKLENFGGIRPRVSARLAAEQRSRHCGEHEVTGGRAARLPQSDDLSGSLRLRVHCRPRLSHPRLRHDGLDAWLAFESPNTDIIRSPVLGDIYNRYYWFSDCRSANVQHARAHHRWQYWRQCPVATRSAAAGAGGALAIRRDWRQRRRQRRARTSTRSSPPTMRRARHAIQRPRPSTRTRRAGT